MVFMTIWERYFLKEVLKTFFLFLICFYGLYVLIDYTHHSRLIQQNQKGVPFFAFTLYYGCEFVNRSEILVPFAILLGTIRTLCKLNENNELVAMMASGVKISKLLRPFLLLGLIFTGLMYVNMEYVLPRVTKELKYFGDAYANQKRKRSIPLAVESVLLEDNSTLLYQKYDSAEKSFFDVYWIRSADDVYKIKSLYPYASPPIGRFVDRLVRNDLNELVLVSSEVERVFPELRFNAKNLTDSLLQPENLALSELWAELPKNHEPGSEKEARLLSTFHRKLALPWLCLLAVVAPAPFCMRFSRQFPVFLVYASGLFGLIGIYIIIDAAHVLGRRQFIDPLYALWTPFVVFFVIFGWRYIRSSR